MCIDIDKIKVMIVAHHFLHICNRVLALDRCQKFVQNFSAQYFENVIEIDHILCTYKFILIRSTLGLLRIIFGTFVTELWPLIDVRTLFCSIF